MAFEVIPFFWLKNCRAWGMKKLIVIILALVCSLASCIENELTNSYLYVIANYETTGEGSLAIIEEYLESKGIPIEKIFYVTGESESINNGRAIAEFQSKVLSISVGDMLEKGVTSGTSFSLQLSSTYKDEEGSQVLASETYSVE